MPTDPTSEFASASGAAVAGGLHPAPNIPDDRSFFGHPRGLLTLFSTEFFERFSYYGMRALLILYMTATALDGGLGFSAEKAGAIYGLYGAGVYLLALPGGWIADKIIGQRHAVFVGGIIIAAGHFSLALDNLPTFYMGLVLIVIGTGFLKPNISTMVGELYPAGDARRDAGFSIFYMGINLGAFVAPIVCSWLAAEIGWHIGFAAAGVGMVAGLIQYKLGGRNLGQAGLYPDTGQDPAIRRGHVRALMYGVGAVIGIVAIILALRAVGSLNISIAGAANITGGLIVGLAVLYFVYMFFAGGLDAVERKRVTAIFVLFIFSAIFWSGFEQAGSSLNLMAERRTDLNMFGWDVPAGFLQSVNAGFIILLAPVFAWIWVALARRNKEPSSPSKFTLGLVFLGLGFAVMIIAAQRSEGGALVSPMFLVLTYLLHTVGELCLSPVGLSTVTKLAPHRMVGQMMGVWFMSISLGNLMAGQVAGQFETMPPADIFLMVTMITIGAGVLLALLIIPIKRLMSGVK